MDFSLASRCSQIVGVRAIEIKHDHSPVVYVVFMEHRFNIIIFYDLTISSNELRYLQIFEEIFK